MEKIIEEIDFEAIIMTLENHWEEFIEYSGGEESAQKTMDNIRKLNEI